MSRKVCVVTGTRAEFGLLRWLIGAIEDDPHLSLQIVATGTHLSQEFGSTYKEIEEAGFSIDVKVDLLLSSDTSIAVTKSMGLGMIGFADAYARLAPDMVLLLGDRFEIFAAASAAMIAGIPIAHIHGGETTEGAFDESIRHAITKMSHLHFVAADEYRRRVIQLGEHPDLVFNVGGMGIDAIKRIQLLTREQLEGMLGLKFKSKNLMITYHPVTRGNGASSAEQLQEILDAVSELKDTLLIFTMPNADTGGRELRKMVEEFVGTHPLARAYTSLGQLRYLSCLAQVDAVVGNSSSGLLEAPAFKVGSINIGERQTGRLCASSVINCAAHRDLIKAAIKKAFSSDFVSKLRVVQSPYGDGGSVEKIIPILKDINIDLFTKKSFFDIHQ